MKKLFAIAALAIFAMAVANAKSYDIFISKTTKAGAVQLKPGEYKVKVEGSNAIFTDTQSSRSVSTPVKLGVNPQKFDETRMETTSNGDTDVLQEIDLGGSTTKLEF